MTKQSVVWGWLAGSSVMVVLIGCAETERTLAGKSLCDWLGGKSSIPEVVDQPVANVVADTRINGRFAITDIWKLKGYLVDQVCMATGGSDGNAGYVQSAGAGKWRTPGSSRTNEEGQWRSSVKNHDAMGADQSVPTCSYRFPYRRG